MLGLRGSEVLQRIRSDPRHQKTKVISYTAHATPDNAGRSVAQG